MRKIHINNIVLWFLLCLTIFIILGICCLTWFEYRYFVQRNSSLEISDEAYEIYNVLLDQHVRPEGDEPIIIQQVTCAGTALWEDTMEGTSLWKEFGPWKGQDAISKTTGAGLLAVLMRKNIKACLLDNR